jgi:DNA-binding XRE family transcriptional regulator
MPFNYSRTLQMPATVYQMPNDMIAAPPFSGGNTSPNDTAAIAARLREARIKAGYRSARAFAQRNAISVTTYQHHENGRRALNLENAARYAAYFRTSMNYLLTGMKLREGTSVPIVGVLRQGGEIEPMFSVVKNDEDASREFPAAKAETRRYPMFKVPDFTTFQAILIEANDMYPAYRQGDIVFFQVLTPMDAALNGLECVVQRADGRQQVRMVVQQANGKVTLMAHSAPPELNVTITGAARVAFIRRADGNALP